jgi:hypothetical protein
MADTDDMVHITQCKFKQLVGKYGACIGKSKQRVIGEDGSDPHCPCMENGFMAEAAETGMPVHNLDLFADDDVSEDREEGEDGREGGLAVYHQKWHMVDLEAVGEVAHAGPAFVGVGYDDDLVSAVYELLLGY